MSSSGLRRAEHLIIAFLFFQLESFLFALDSFRMVFLMRILVVGDTDVEDFTLDEV